MGDVSISKVKTIWAKCKAANKKKIKKKTGMLREKFLDVWENSCIANIAKNICIALVLTVLAT
jgi:hypothetical protein